MSIPDDPFLFDKHFPPLSPSHLRQSLVFEDDDESASSSVNAASPSVELSSLLLPSTTSFPTPQEQQRDHLQEATSLVRDHSSGRTAFVKRRERSERTAAGWEEERREVELDDDDAEGSEQKDEGVVNRILTPPNNLNTDGFIPSNEHNKHHHHRHGLGGVLSSLLALHHHHPSSSHPSSSPEHSPPTTGSSRVSLASEDGGQEEDEPAERAKFIREKRLRRALEAGWLTSGGLVDAQLSPVRPPPPAPHLPPHPSGSRPTFSRSSSSGRSSAGSSIFAEMMAATSALSVVASPPIGTLISPRSILLPALASSRPPSILQTPSSSSPHHQPSTPRPILNRQQSPASGGSSSSSSTSLLNLSRSRSALTTPSTETVPRLPLSSSSATSPNRTNPTPSPNRTNPTSPNLSFLDVDVRERAPPILKKTSTTTTATTTASGTASASGGTGAGSSGLMKHVELAVEGMIHPLDVVRSFAPEELSLFPRETMARETMDEREQRAWEKEKVRRRKRREKKKREVTFITKHVADILARQDFILKLGQALMKFGAPSHRVDAQMQATARALDLTCQMVYLPGLMLLSFGDPATHTSDTKFLKQDNGLELSKLLSTHMLYWNVVHDRMAVNEASDLLDVLIASKPTYNFWWSVLIGGLCSACIQPSAFSGSFIDCLVSIPLGMLLVVVQVGIVKIRGNLLLFEMTITMLNAFLSAALAQTGHFCFASVASGSVVLVLPGYLFLAGSLELGNRAVISGSVRLVYAIIYSLMLGFGLSIGSEVYIRVTGTSIRGSSDYSCTALRLDAPWYRATISPWWYFLSVPAYIIGLAARNGQPVFRWQAVVMMAFGSAGFSANYFSGRVFTGRPDITSMFGSFVVGALGGIYGRFTRGSAFVVIVPGILLQLPSGMLQGGLLRQASDSTTLEGNSFASGYSVATQLISVSIGLSVGLFLAAAAVNTIGGGRKKIVNLSYF